MTPKEKRSERNKEYRLKNKDRLDKYSKKYIRSSRGIWNVLHTQLRKISQEDFIKWYESQLKQCAYCNITPEDYHKLPWRINKLTKRLSIDKINPNGFYELGNIALCCSSCNITKSNKSAERMKWIGQEINKPKWQAEIQRQKDLEE